MTRDEQKTKAELLQELDALRRCALKLKQVEEELKHSEKQFKELNENTFVGVYRTTPDGRITMANPALVRMLGYSSFEELSQQNLEKEEFAPQYPRSIFKDLIEREGKVVGLESAWRKRDGTTLFITENAWVVRDESGKTLYYEGIVQDITERKRAEEALRKREELHELFFSQSLDGFFYMMFDEPIRWDDTVDKEKVLDYVFAHHRITKVNDAMLQQYGASQKQFIGLTPNDLYAHDIAYGRNVWRDFLDAGRLHLETDERKLDGTPIWIDGDYICLYDSQGRITGHFGIQREITEEKRAREALRESEEKYRSIFNTAASLITSIGTNGVIVGCNARIKNVLGYEKDEVVGQSIAKIIHPDYMEKAKTCLNEVLTAGLARHKEYKMVRKDNKVIDVEINAAGIKNKQGKYVEGICIIEDITERKEVEQALAESEEKFRSIFDNANDIIASVTKTGKILEVNKKIEDILGYKPDELVGKNILTSGILAKKNAATIVKLFKKSVKRGRLLDIRDGRNVTEVWVNHKDGHTVLLEANTTTIKEAGKLVGYLSVIRDITERKRAEEAYRSLVDHSLQGLAIFQKGRVVFANQAMADITGYTVEEMLTLPHEQVETFVHPDDRELVWSRHRDRLNGEELPERYEFHGIRKDGSICWLEINSSRIEFQGKPAIQVAYVDITERKNAEEALRDSESKYRTLVENLPQKIFLKDKNSVYVSCNDNLARDFKIKSEEITGKTDYDLVPKALADKYRADDKRIIELGETKTIEEKYMEEGEERIIHTVKTPVKDEQGNTIGVLGIFWDITELKQAQEKINKYREDMVQAEELATVGTLSATLAHELTQPLTVLSLSIGNSLAELETMSCPGSVVENLKEGLSEITIMTSMINRFRNFAKMSLKSTVSKVDLKAVAERIVELLDESAWRAKVTLQIEEMDKLPPIYSCVRELEQLFFSLIENAIQAADGKKSRQVIISSVVKDEHIELQLSDNCGGIAPENLDRIFEPFFTTKPAGQRTGLGLCVAERIVNRAGGKIRVESKLGKGSIFFVTLPINKDEE